MKYVLFILVLVTLALAAPMKKFEDTKEFQLAVQSEFNLVSVVLRYIQIKTFLI